MNQDSKKWMFMVGLMLSAVGLYWLWRRQCQHEKTKTKQSAQKKLQNKLYETGTTHGRHGQLTTDLLPKVIRQANLRSNGSGSGPRVVWSQPVVNPDYNYWYWRLDGNGQESHLGRDPLGSPLYYIHQWIEASTPDSKTDTYGSSGYNNAEVYDNPCCYDALMAFCQNDVLFDANWFQNPKFKKLVALAQVVQNTNGRSATKSIQGSPDFVAQVGHIKMSEIEEAMKTLNTMNERTQLQVGQFGTTDWHSLKETMCQLIQGACSLGKTGTDPAAPRHLMNHWSNQKKCHLDFLTTFDPFDVDISHFLRELFASTPYLYGRASFRIQAYNLTSGSRGWGFWNTTVNSLDSVIVWFVQFAGMMPDKSVYPLQGFWAMIQAPGLPSADTVSLVKLPDLDEQWHDYVIEWSPSEIRFVMDGKVVHAETQVIPRQHAAIHCWVDNAIFGLSGGIQHILQDVKESKGNVVQYIGVQTLLT